MPLTISGEGYREFSEPRFFECSTIEDLKKIRNPVDKAHAIISGDNYTEVYKFDSDSVADDDEIDIIESNNSLATGRWKRTGGLVNARLFGVSPDNTAAANSLALANAANNSDGKLLYIPAGVYQLNSQITTVNLAAIGDGDGTVLDFSSATGSFPDSSNIFARGSVEQIEDLNGDVAEGDTQLVLTSANADVVAGSVLCIYNPTNSSWSSGRTYWRAGEWVKVRSVSGATITLDAPLYKGYAAAAVDIYLLTPGSINLSRMKFLFKPASTYGITARFCENVHLTDITMDSSALGQINIDRCYAGSINCVRGVNYTTLAGNNYGIVFSNSYGFSVKGCNLKATNHAIATGGGDWICSVPNREIIATANVTTGLERQALDFHDNAENCHYIGNFANGGISLNGHKVSAKFNSIRTNVDTGGYAIFRSNPVSPDCVIEGNEITCTCDWNSGFGIIHCPFNADAAFDGTQVIRNNKIDFRSFSGGHGIHTYINDDTTADIDVDVIGNELYRSDLLNFMSINVENEGAPHFKRVRVERNKCVKGGIRCERMDGTSLDVIGNRVHEQQNRGIQVTSAATTASTATQISILNNHVYDSKNQGLYIRGTPDKTQFAIIFGNVVLRSNTEGLVGTADTDIFCDRMALAEIRENTVTPDNTTNIISVQDIDLLLLSRNISTDQTKQNGIDRIQNIAAEIPFDTWGSGDPESVVTGPIGSRFARRDGGASTSIYIKESGTGNTGWIAK